MLPFFKKNKEPDEKETFSERFYDNVSSQVTDKQYIALGTFVLLVLAGIFYFLEKEIFKSIITNLVVFYSLITFGLKGYVNYKNGESMKRIIPFLLIPIIVIIITGVVFK